MREWRLYQSVIFLLLAYNVAAHPESCAGACELALSHLVFPDVDASLGYYPNQCGSRLRVTSVYVCMRSYCRPGEIAAGWKRFNGDCELYGHITLPPLNIIDNVTNDQVSQYRHFGIDEFDIGLELDRPAFAQRALFDVACRTKDAWNNSVTTRHAYGNAMFYFWTAVILIGIGNRVWAGMRWNLSSTSAPEHNLRRQISTLLQRHLTLPATFSHHCAEPIGWCTIPPRLHTCTLIIFAIINTMLCCVNYDVFESNLYWTTPVQWSRYIGDRTGILATANLPILWLFATRNNILLYLTGWSFETAMHFHRWIARISTIEAVVHSIAYTVCSVLLGSWSHYWAEWKLRYWTMGALATVVMCLLCAFSVYPLRQHRYELFLLLHISLGLLTLLGMWYHVEIFNGDYNWYLWPCLAIWALDRVMRLGRLAYLNFPLRASSVAWDAKANVVTLSMPCAVTRQPRPGEYFFLYFLHDRAFYESHPFTLSSWSCGPTGKPSLNFLIRPYDGFTRRLADLARNTGSAKARVLLEGPYGPAHDLTHHDSLVFVVGGTGIAVALAYLTDMCARIQHNHPRYRAQHVRIIWAVQHLAMFSQVYEQEIQQRIAAMTESAHAGTFELKLDVYITRPSSTRAHDTTDAATHSTSSPDRPQHTGVDQDEDQSEHSPLLSPSPSHSPPRAVSPTEASAAIPLANAATSHASLTSRTIRTLHNLTRPDIPTLILDAMRWNSGIQATASPASRDIHAAAEVEDEEHESKPPSAPQSPQRPRSRIAIISCGPASLADATRAAVVHALSLSTSGCTSGGTGTCTGRGFGGRSGTNGGGREGVDVTFYSESYSW